MNYQQYIYFFNAAPPACYRGKCMKILAIINAITHFQMWKFFMF